MNNGCFAQYLLNIGKIREDELGTLLRRSADTTIGLLISAIGDGLLAEDSPDGAGKTANEEKTPRVLLFDEDLRFAQVLFDEKRMSLEELKELFDACNAQEPSPIRQAVLDQAVGGGFLMEAERYADFSELFVRSCKRFMETPVIVKKHVSTMESPDGLYTISQRLIGDMTMVAGIRAADAVFVEMARRYSHEDIAEVDEMAKDSLSEFLNVVNGLFVVDVARREFEIDLDVPRISKNAIRDDGSCLVLPLETGFGSFALALAGDEFVSG